MARARKKAEVRTVKRNLVPLGVYDPEGPDHNKVAEPIMKTVGVHTFQRGVRLVDAPIEKITIKEVFDPLGEVILHEKEQVLVQQGMWIATDESGNQWAIHPEDLELHYTEI